MSKMMEKVQRSLTRQERSLDKPGELMTADARKYVQVHIDYYFKNIGLLEQAFTRSSYSAEHGGGDNEILEFIGDKALDLVVVKYLAEKHGSFAEGEDSRGWLEGRIPLERGRYDPFITDYNEGELTEMKAQLVQKKTLARRVEYLGFEDFLIMGKGDVERQVNQSQSVKEDLFEAIIGAVTLDSGWNLETIAHVAENMLEYAAELEEDEETINYIGRLQDWSLAKTGELPVYHVEMNERDGASVSLGKAEVSLANMETHAKDDSENVSFAKAGKRPYVMGEVGARDIKSMKYVCAIEVPGLEEAFLDFGDSQGEARMLAAKTAMRFIHEKGLEFTVRDEIPDPSLSEAINQLEILSRRGYFPLPTYDFREIHDADGNPLWEATCHVKGYRDVTSEGYPVKKMAKKNAAFEMLKGILEI